MKRGVFSLGLIEEFIKLALDSGLDDVGFVSPEPFEGFDEDGLRILSEEKMERDPHKVMKEASCIIVLFKFCPPFSPFPEGYAKYPAYYASSNASYHAARGLAAFLRERGFAALHTSRIPQRSAALRYTGFVGDNRLMYTAEFGSYFAIQTILTDAFSPQNRKDSKEEACLHCGRCSAACPTMALKDGFEEYKCVRYQISGRDISKADARYMSGLIGCEICQKSCPLNEKHGFVTPKAEDYEPFKIEGLICGDNEQLKKTSAIVGKNFARYLPIQANLYYTQYKK